MVALQKAVAGLLLFLAGSARGFDAKDENKSIGREEPRRRMTTPRAEAPAAQETDVPKKQQAPVAAGEATRRLQKKSSYFLLSENY